MRDILRTLIELPLYYISGLFKRKENRIIFGTWNGEKYADNSKYIFEYLKGKNEYELIWVGKREIESQIPKGDNIWFVEHDSWGSYRYALTAKYAFITHSQNDISKFNLLKGAKIIQLWHGIGIKNLAPSTSNKTKMSYKIRVRIQSIVRRYDYFICSSKANKKRNLIAFKSYGIDSNNVIPSGQPRNDLFFNYNYNDIEKIRNNYFKKYSIPANKKIITYLPTFRKDKSEQFLFSTLSREQMEQLEKILKKHNVILLEKVHHQDKGVNRKGNNNNKYIHNIGNFNDIDTQELLLISDILVTDYSSCYMDYILLDRPIIHFAYDYEKYKNEDKGFYYDFYDIAAGDIVENVESLIESIKNNLDNPKHKVEQRTSVKNKMMEYEQGKGGEIISKEIGL